MTWFDYVILQIECDMFVYFILLNSEILVNSVNKNLVRDSHGLFPGKGEYLLVLGECPLHSPSLCNRLLRNFFPRKR